MLASHKTSIDRAARLCVIVCVVALSSGLTSCASPDAARKSDATDRRLSDGPSVWTREAPPRGLWVEELDLAGVQQGWGSAQARRSVDGNSITIAGRVYPHGVGSHAVGEAVITLNGAAESFHADVGIDDEGNGQGSAVFIVLVDGVEAAKTDVLRGGQPAVPLHVDLRGARELLLVVEDGGDGIDYDHADWAGAMLVMRSATDVHPTIVMPKPEPPPEIAHGDPPTPEIHAPRVTGATPGREFLFRIPTTGTRPLKFSAAGLPVGLTLDADTGILRGRVTVPGRYEVGLTVSGPAGVARSTLTIVGAADSLAQTPPMGWNSWNVWGTAVDDQKVRDAADWLVKSGLADHGYQYVNIDDAWEAGRDEQGRIQSNEKFPDMRALAEYVHSRGLKLGIYSSPGPKTCAGYEASYEHELLDAQQYADWGIDLLKYDWCSYGGIAKDDSFEELRKPYDVMRAALDAVDRDIVFSLCQYGMGDVWVWGAAVGGNYWRTTGDITDTWASLSSIGFGQSGREDFAAPGHWNDPDMLVVGKVGWGPNIRDTRLTPNEQVTHITLWSLLAAPLLIGCDLSQLDEFTLALLTNPEVIEINQDRMGRQARRVVVSGSTEVWSRPLADGSTAVGLFNRGRVPMEVRADFALLGLSGPVQVRDVWRRADAGDFTGAYTATVARHGAVFVVLRPAAARGATGN